MSLQAKNSSAEKLITQHLDTWTQAIETKSTAGRGSSNKLNLVGIQKLRELILEMAVRGLLVPQDPNDEHASELLKKIAAEKAQLIKDGKIKKSKPLPDITDDEKPFDLPDGWEWVRFQETTIYVQRGKGPKYADSGKVRVVSQKCVQWSGFDISVARYVEDSSVKEYQEERFLKKNDLLWNSTGTGTVGRVNVLSDISEQLVADSHVTVIRPLNIDSNFIKCYLSSGAIQRRIEPDSENPLVSGSTKQVELNTSSVNSLPIPIAPLEEQKRIVAKVDNLMALCDQLESQTLDSIATHQTLVETLLGNLVNPENTANFDQAWSLIAQNFDVLFTTEHSIDTLKQTILQLAVMGKLVPQNPNDEPASELLKKIAAEKAKLIANKKIKKSNPLPEITETEKPFDLPNGWEWVKLNEIISMMDAGWSPACPPEPSPDNETWGVLKTTSVQTLQFLPEENKLLPSNKEPRPQYEVKSGDILVTRAGPWNRVGISCLVKETRPKLMTSDKLIRFHLVDVGMSEEYMVLALQAGATAEYLESCKSGMASSQVNISQDKLKAAPIPLPALEEQKRIVTKVNELMTLCDQLKTQLQSAQQTQIHLAQSIAQEALA
jgi:type I restriction enzyme S subunit